MKHPGRYIAIAVRSILIITLMMAAFASQSRGCPFQQIGKKTGSDACCSRDAEGKTDAGAKGCCGADRALRCCCYPPVVLGTAPVVHPAPPMTSLPVVLLDAPIRSFPSDPPFHPPKG